MWNECWGKNGWGAKSHKPNLWIFPRPLFGSPWVIYMLKIT